MQALALALLTTVAPGADESAAAALDVAALLREMTDRAAPTRGALDYTAGLRSSTDASSIDTADADTWFANEDAGNFLRMEERDGRSEAVLLDVAGPGAIVRIWSGNPRGTLRIYVDGAAQPAVAEDMARLLTGDGPVAPPLAAERSRGANFYFPIPYAERCVVTCELGDPLLAYQIQYRSYVEGTLVRSFQSGDFETFSGLASVVGRELTSPQPPEADATLPFSFSLTPGQPQPVRALELDVARNLACPPGPRAVTELRMRIEPVGDEAAERLEQVLRQSVLSIRFDGRRTVLAPLGDFFGSAPGANTFSSWPLSVEPSGELVSRFWMPFRESCVLRIDCAGRERLAVRGHVATRPIDWNDDTLYFHARWSSSGSFSTRPPRDWTVLDVEGRGVYVGDMLSVANPLLAWWGEGDEKIYVDGSPLPTLFGTGTDDYYGYAFASPQRFSAPFHCQTRCDGPQNFGHTSLNRFRALDAIPFRSRLRFDLGVVHWGQAELSLAATSYFYAELDARYESSEILERVATGVPRLTYEPFRVPGAVECEELAIAGRSEGLQTETQYRDPLPDAAWSGGTVLRVQAEQPGQFIEWTLPAGEPGERDVTAYLSGCADCGQVQFSLDGEPLGEVIDTFRDSEDVQPPEAFLLARVPFDGAGAVLRAEVISTNERSRPPHYAFLVDCLVLE